MNSHTSKKLKQVVAASGLVLIVTLLACRSTQQNLNKPAESAPAPAAPTAPPDAKEAKVIEADSKFDHTRAEHKLDCARCHKRDSASPTEAIPRQPYHDACNACHTKEDFIQTSTKSSFCAVCHTTEIASPEGKGVLVAFPLRQKQFGIKGGLQGFSHKTHMDPQKMEGTAPRCDLCHRFESRGVQSTFPKHAECYSCHTHQAGQKLGDCGVCHTDVNVAVKYSPGMGTALSLYNFRHSSSHLKAASCDRCHRTLDPPSEPTVDIQQISTARGQRHSSACWSCHNQAREPVCTKCHVGSLPF